MQTDSMQAGTGFGGHFHNHGGSQFMGNHFNTGGAPIYFHSSSDHRLPASVCELPDSILSPHFTGRGDELQQIDRAFSASSGDLPARCVIYGMPGVGKTQLALQYASLASGRSQDTYTFWVSAGSVEKLARDFSRLVDLLRLPGRHASDQFTKLTLARAWLEDPSAGKEWLLVLDNVTRETARMMLDDILPRRNSGGRLLFTTRTDTIAESCTIPGKSLMLALQPPGIDDAVAMLVAGAEIGGGSTEEASYADLERLVRSVGNLPLAVDQAASYIKGYESSTKELLDLYRSEEIMEVLSWENDLSRHEETSVVATFMPALERISQTAPDALTLLRILSFCDPEHIPISILKQGCGALYQEERSDIPAASAVNELGTVIDLFQSSVRLSKAIQEIQRASFAVYAPEGSERVIRIHDLVQLLLRSKLIAAAAREQWLEIVIRIVCKAFEGIGDRRSPRNWGRCGQFISHIEFMEGFAAQYGLRNATLLDASMWAAIYIGECGLYQKAAGMQKQTWERKKAILGEEHPSTLTSMANLAATYWNQGRWKEAEELEVGVMETTKRVLGEEHPSTLSSIANLAATYWNQGRWKEAEELEVGVMETRKRVLGEEHSDTLSSMANLAATYRKQGRWKEAEELGVRAIETRKRVLGEEHPDTLSSMANLASTYRKQGRWKEAEELEVGVIETTKRVLGEEHPDTLSSMANLAAIYRKQGRWKEAEELDVGVIETRKRVLGEEHPSTLSSMANLASTYRNQGRWKEAEELGVRVIETTKRVLGEEHPDTLTSMANLAATYRNQGRWKEAEELEVGVMETRKRVLGEGHPSTRSSIANLAATYWNQGRWKEAEELEVGVMETTKRVLGEEHPSTLSSIANLAATYWNQGRWKEAEELDVGVMETTKRVLGEEHPDTLSSIANLAAIYWNQGRWKEAEELGVRVIETTKRVLGEEHPDTLSSMANLASTYRKQGRWKEAEELEVGVIETTKRVLGEGHPDTLSSMNNLALTWKAQGQNAKAINLMEECIYLRNRILGVDHPLTLSSSAAFTEWQIQEPKVGSSATNKMTITKGEPKRLDEGSIGLCYTLGAKEERVFD